MPLPLPVLDRRTWSELVSEARTLLPRYTTDWTDHNVHDPGVTFIDMFAWLSEILIFRADRVSPSEIRAFLRWFGITPKPALCARTVIALELPMGGGAQPLPARLKVADPTSDLVFQADDPLTVSPAWVELDSSEGTHRGQIWSRAGGTFSDFTAHNCRPGLEFMPLGPAPQPDDALWLGFDCQPGAPGQVLSLHFWTPTWMADAAERVRLIDDEAEQSDCPPPAASWNTRSECVEATCEDGPAPKPAPPAPTWFLHYSARVQWEAWDGAAWQSLTVIVDETRALTMTGLVRLSLVTHVAGPGGAPLAAYWWLRCRLVSGGYDCPPRLSAIAVNALTALHSATVKGPEVLGVSDGHAEQVYLLQGKIAEQGARAVPQPLVAGSLRLRLTSAGPPDDSWFEVPNWDRSGPYDPHFVAEGSDNSLHFGNGRVGRVAPAGSTLEALDYRVGGGTAGNLGAGRLSRVIAGGVAGLTVRQPFAAAEGLGEESLDQAHGRALAELGRPARGVTVDDWRTLALQVPGVPVGRALPIPGFHPDFPCWTSPGVVTVVVLPSCGRPPVPSRSFLAAVSRYLERRRPLTTELHVVGPNYVKVTITATLHTARGYPDVARQAQAALDALFDPLHGGPDGSGWPFGRGVLESDLMVTLGRLPGVRFVDGLGIASDEGSATCDNLALCPTDLVASQTHRLTVVEG